MRANGKYTHMASHTLRGTNGITPTSTAMRIKKNASVIFCPRVNVAGGKAFAEFVLAPETQDVIRTFGIDKYGQALFVPIAGKTDEDL